MIAVENLLTDNLYENHIDFSNYTYKVFSNSKSPFIFNKTFTNILAMDTRSVFEQPGKIYENKKFRDDLIKEIFEKKEIVKNVHLYGNNPIPIPIEMHVVFNKTTGVIMFSSRVLQMDYSENLIVEFDWNQEFIIVNVKYPVSDRLYGRAITTIEFVSREMKSPIIFFNIKNPEGYNFVDMHIHIQNLKVFKKICSNIKNIKAFVLIVKQKYFVLLNAVTFLFGGISSHFAPNMASAISLAYAIRHPDNIYHFPSAPK